MLAEVYAPRPTHRLQVPRRRIRPPSASTAERERNSGCMYLVAATAGGRAGDSPKAFAACPPGSRCRGNWAGRGSLARDTCVRVLTAFHLSVKRGVGARPPAGRE